MYKPLATVFAFMFLMFSCKKKEEPTCNYQATIAFECSAYNTVGYTAFINGRKMDNVNPGETITYQTDTGCYLLSAGQKQDTVCLKPCETAIFFGP